MKRLMIVRGWFGLWALLTVLFLYSCGYNSFEDIPSEGEVETGDSVEVISISQLKSLYVEGGVTLTTDAVVRGVVTANDVADNFYKKIVIQDSAGAVAIALGQYDLHNYYPLGASVSVRVRGLRLGMSDRMLHLGLAPQGDASEEIAEIATLALMTKYMFDVQKGGEHQPVVRKISELTVNDVGRLVRIDGIVADLSMWSRWAQSEKYSPSGYARSMDIAAMDSEWRTIYIYTSGYAQFADSFVPESTFSVTGIVLKKNDSEYRIQMRSLDDVVINN
jgi:predicted methyltransferase MtxX (methanogen marker protein 4)